MIFTEPRSDKYDLAAAIENLVRAKGPQSLQDVFKRLPGYIHLTRVDQRRSNSRSCELMWQTNARNVSRNQNYSPKYRKYPPIPNCALEYKNCRFILRELDDPHDVRDARDIHDAQGGLFDK